MKNRLLSGLAFAGTLAITGPLAAIAQESDAQARTSATADAPLRTAATPDARQGDEAVRREAHARHRHGTHRHHHHRTAQANGMHAGPQGFHWLHGLRGLDLSEAQRDGIFELRHAQAPELREQGKVLRAAGRELRALSMSDGYDEAKARELSERMAEARSRMALLHARTGNEVWKTLTPEQREKLANRSSHKGTGPHGTPRSTAS
jgi:Spy/CpxP family protein refolding chaperone